MNSWDITNKIVKYQKKSRLFTLAEARAIIAQSVGETSYDEAKFKTTYKSTKNLNSNTWVAVGDENNKDYV